MNTPFLAISAFLTSTAGIIIICLLAAALMVGAAMYFRSKQNSDATPLLDGTSDDKTPSSALKENNDIANSSNPKESIGQNITLANSL